MQPLQQRNPATADPKLSRRRLLEVAALASGGMAVGLQRTSPARTAASEASADFVPNAFVRVDHAGTITLIMSHTEVGQGIMTSSAMLIGEELEAGLDQIRVEPASPDLAKYMDPYLFDQATGGSMSTRSDWVRLREATAATRTMLVGATAEGWLVEPATCRVERGVIHHDATGGTIGYGAIAGAAARRPVPQRITLKSPAQFTLIGTHAKRLDTPSKVDGTTVYGIDTRLPGMQIGMLAIAPTKGGKLIDMNEAAAREVPGVRDVIRAGDEAMADVVASRGKASESPGVIARRQGDAKQATANAKTTLSPVYQLPFLSHSPMEPLNCMLHIGSDHAEVWVGTQVPVRAQKAAADATGLPLEQVVLHNQPMDGAFGRRLEVDSIIAAAIVKQITPVTSPTA